MPLAPHRLAAQLGITLLDPFTAIMWDFGFSEQAQTGSVHLGLATGGGILMVVGAQLLSRSPILEHGRCSGRLAPLAHDAPTLTFGGATPDPLALTVGQRVLEAGLANRAHLAHGLGRLCVRVVVGIWVEDLDVDAPAGGPLAPRGGHGKHIL